MKTVISKKYGELRLGECKCQPACSGSFGIRTVNDYILTPAHIWEVLEELSAPPPESLIGKCVEVGNDKDGQARLVIHTTHEQLMNFRANLAFADVEVTLHGMAHSAEVDAMEFAKRSIHESIKNKKAPAVTTSEVPTT